MRLEVQPHTLYEALGGGSYDTSYGNLNALTEFSKYGYPGQIN